MSENEGKTIAPSTAFGMRAVLNGGKRILESATLPIQWFFDELVAVQKPKWVLILVQSESDQRRDGYGRCGRRYLFPVTDRVAFVQLNRAGPHRVIILACTGDRPKGLLKPGDYPNEEYDRPIYESDDRKGYYYAYTTSIASFTEEFEVPANLFAKRSDHPIAKALWQWVNWRREKQPVDQCQYRRRALWAFSGQLGIVAFLLVWRYLIALATTIMLVTGRFLAFFFGFRPLFASGLGDLWNFNFPLKEVSTEYRRYPWDGYRVWKRTGYERRRQADDVKMPVTPFQATLGLFIVYELGRLAWSVSADTWLLSLLVLLYILRLAAIGSFSYIATRYGLNLVEKKVHGAGWFKRWAEKRAARAVLRAEEKNKEQQAKLEAMAQEAQSRPVDAYTRWLTTEMSTTRAPARVDLDHLPKPFRNGAAQKLRTTFWAAKTRVCKPFAR